jgi:hypothetical protein
MFRWDTGFVIIGLLLMVVSGFMKNSEPLLMIGGLIFTIGFAKS